MNCKSICTLKFRFFIYIDEMVGFSPTNMLMKWLGFSPTKLYVYNKIAGDFLDVAKTCYYSSPFAFPFGCFIDKSLTKELEVSGH